MFIKDCVHVSRLILPDLCFEWILSVCMIFALGAIFAPLFILLGLQEGIVGNMIDQLKRNPSSRLITPKYPLRRPLDEEWLKSLGERAAMLMIAPTSRLLLDIEGYDELVNTVPTIAEDPLMLENDIRLSDNESVAVLSFNLAQRIDKKVDDPLTVVLIRFPGQEERAAIPCRVAGILPQGASSDVKLWIPRQLFQWFYRWRKGQAVPELGLSGRGDFLVPEYDGIATIVETVPSDEDYRLMLSGKISFSQPPQPYNNMGWTPPPHLHVRLWRSINSRVYESDFAPLVNRHHELGYSVETVPFIEDFEIMVKSNETSAKRFLTILPDSLKPDNIDLESQEKPYVWCSVEDGVTDNGKGVLSFYSGSEQRPIEISVDLIPTPEIRSGFIAVPDESAGKMNAARRQAADFDPVTGEFSPVSEEMRYFWVYARSIDGLEELLDFIRQEGIKQASNALREPNSKVDEVRNIRRLAGYMEQIYLLIVVVSGVSGIFAIAASVYAGVQRKRHDLAYLELLGLHPAALFVFPYLKSLMLIAGGVATAGIAYLIFGHFSNKLFMYVLGEAESLTRLTGQNVFFLIFGIFVVGSAASLLAAISVMRIEPGEYIRE